MFVDTDDIGAAGLEVDRTLEPAILSVSDGPEEPELLPVRVTGRIVKQDLGFGFRGMMQAAVRLPCSRCLEPYWLELELPFDLIYKEAPPADAGGREESEPEDPSFSYLDDGRIDVGQLAREQLYLALPLKPLCREECPGLCTRCGARRADGDCGCEVNEVDPRWAVLEEWKKRL